MQLRPRRIEFKILGDTQVLVDGQPLGIGGPRTRAVLAMLAVSAGKIVAADVLQDELWPGQPAERAAANLQVRMSELRARSGRRARISGWLRGHRGTCCGPKRMRWTPVASRRCWPEDDRNSRQATPSLPLITSARR